MRSAREGNGKYERQGRTCNCWDCRQDFIKKGYKRGRDGKIRCPPCSAKFRGSAAYNKEVSLFTLYGITMYTYNTLLAAQNGLCAICNKTCTKSLGVDHNHATGKVRGLLCQKCNLMIGNALEDKNILAAAIKYLEKHNGT